MKDIWLKEIQNFQQIGRNCIEKVVRSILITEVHLMILQNLVKQEIKHYYKKLLMKSLRQIEIFMKKDKPIEIVLLSKNASEASI